MSRQRGDAGFSLVELTISVLIVGLLVIGLSGVVRTTLAARDEAHARNDLARDARFAMARMVNAVRVTTWLMVPRRERSSTGYFESIRDPGVLALTMDPTLDRDVDGFADADNDKDGLVDEDFGMDSTNDGKAGVIGIDDDNNGWTDDSWSSDDDEVMWFPNEDAINGADDDGDGLFDEDAGSDMNGDGAPGVVGVDDDGDGSTDEGNTADDDEDGSVDEDWRDVVVFHLSGSDLIERRPDVNPTSGTDYTEYTIAEGVTQFRTEFLPANGNRTDLVLIQLELGTPPDSVYLEQRVRVGDSP